MQCRSTKPSESTASLDEISQVASKGPTELGLSNFSLLYNHNNPIHYDTEFGKSILFASKVLSHGPIGHGVDCLDYYVAKQS